MTAAELRERDEQWWWLSFADGERPRGARFLGAAIVRGVDLVAAVREAHRLGVNPGGEVLGVQIPAEHLAPVSFRERLMSRVEIEAAEAAGWVES